MRDTIGGLESETVFFDNFQGQETKKFSWIVRGDDAGAYTLVADYAGTLNDFEVPVSAHIESEPITVYGKTGVTAVLYAMKEAKYGVLYFDIGLRNDRAVSLYLPSLKLSEVTITEGANTYTRPVQLLSTRFKNDAGYEVAIPTSTEELRPGEEVVWRFAVYDVEGFAEPAQFVAACGLSELNVDITTVDYSFFDYSDPFEKTEEMLSEGTMSDLALDFLLSDDEFYYMTYRDLYGPDLGAALYKLYAMTVKGEAFSYNDDQVDEIKDILRSLLADEVPFLVEDSLEERKNVMYRNACAAAINAIVSTGLFLNDGVETEVRKRLDKVTIIDTFVEGNPEPFMTTLVQAMEESASSWYDKEKAVIWIDYYDNLADLNDWDKGVPDTFKVAYGIAYDMKEKGFLKGGNLVKFAQKADEAMDETTEAILALMYDYGVDPTQALSAEETYAKSIEFLDLLIAYYSSSPSQTLLSEMGLLSFDEEGNRTINQDEAMPWLIKNVTDTLSAIQNPSIKSLEEAIQTVYGISVDLSAYNPEDYMTELPKLIAGRMMDTLLTSIARQSLKEDLILKAAESLKNDLKDEKATFLQKIKAATIKTVTDGAIKIADKAVANAYKKLVTSALLVVIPNTAVVGVVSFSAELILGTLDAMYWEQKYKAWHTLDYVSELSEAMADITRVTIAQYKIFRDQATSAEALDRAAASVLEQTEMLIRMRYLGEQSLYDYLMNNELEFAQLSDNAEDVEDLLKVQAIVDRDTELRYAEDGFDSLASWYAMQTSNIAYAKDIIFAAVPVDLESGDPPFEALTIDYAAERTVEVIPTDCEYRFSLAGNWIQGTGERLMLSPGTQIRTLYVRTMATSQSRASNEVILVIPARQKITDAPRVYDLGQSGGRHRYQFSDYEAAYVIEGYAGGGSDELVLAYSSADSGTSHPITIETDAPIVRFVFTRIASVNQFASEPFAREPESLIQISTVATPGGNVLGAGTYFPGDQVTLTALPDENHQLDYWFTNGTRKSIEGNAYSFAALYDTEIKAVFRGRICMISVSSTDSALGSVSYATTSRYGDVCTVRASVRAGASAAFAGWYDGAGADANLLSTNPSYAFAIGGDAALWARFEPTQYTLGVAYDAAMGTVAGASSGDIDAFSEVRLEAIPAPGHSFVSWINGDAADPQTAQILSVNQVYSFTMTADTSVRALFKENQYTVRFIDIDGLIRKTQLVGYGESAVPPVLSRVGLRFVGWSGSYENVTCDIDVYAQYVREETYHVELTGGYLASGGTSGDYQISSVLTAIAYQPPMGMVFSYWENVATGAVVAVSESYRFIVGGNLALRAVFELDRTAVTPFVTVGEPTFNSAGKATFPFQITLTDGYTLVECGAVYRKLNEFVPAQTPDDLLLTSPGASYVRSSKQSSTGQYTVSSTPASDIIIYMRGYLIYQDIDGNLYTVYSENVEATRESMYVP